MRYIDFDGVIMDTWNYLFDEWSKNPDNAKAGEDKLIAYIQNKDWREVLQKAKIINDSINILNSMDPRESAILTKVHSITNEASAKTEFLREFGVKQQIICVPYYIRKCDYVDPLGNILVDDSLRNLTEWESLGGIPMFFDLNGDNIDPWKDENTFGYQRVRRIDEKVK